MYRCVCLGRSMGKTRRNELCPCGSGKKYKNCCFQADFVKESPAKKMVDLTVDDVTQIPTSATAIDSVPTHNKNGLSPDITADQMMDLCLDEIAKLLASESVGTVHDLVDKVILAMDLIPTFTYREFA